MVHSFHSVAFFLSWCCKSNKPPPLRKNETFKKHSLASSSRWWKRKLCSTNKETKRKSIQWHLPAEPFCAPQCRHGCVLSAQRDVQFRQISWENPSLRRLVRMVRNVRLKMEKLSYKSSVQERIFDYWCAFVSKVKKLNVWDLFIFSCDILARSGWGTQRNRVSGFPF